MIVDDNAGDVGEQGVASDARVIERQQARAGHVQPFRLTADAKAGLVHVFDRRGRDETTHRFGEPLQARGAGPAHTIERRAARS